MDAWDSAYGGHEEPVGKSLGLQLPKDREENRQERVGTHTAT